MDLVKTANLARKNHRMHLEQLANMRLMQLASEWRTRFPKRKLHIMFGNGTQLISIDDRYDIELCKNGCSLITKNYQRRDITYRFLDFSFLQRTLIDVLDILDDYSSGCPNDLIVETDI